MEQTTEDPLRNALQIIIGSIIFLGAGFAALFIAKEPKPEPCHRHGFNFTVVDSIGRRFRPVPCPCESQDHTGCGDLDPYEEDEYSNNSQQIVTIIGSNGKRKKAVFVWVEYNTNPTCEPDYRPNFRLERITD